MAARAVQTAAVAVAGAGRRVAGRAGPPPPLLVSCRSGAESRYSTSARHKEEERTDAGGMTGAQVEAALNRKNVEVLQGEEHVATVLPDETLDGVLENVAAGEDASSWVPDQETGVFVPADADTASQRGRGAQPAPPGAGASSASVLDQTVFVREEDMEDVERPAMADMPMAAPAARTRRSL